jgi:hypothetical protein
MAEQHPGSGLTRGETEMMISMSQRRVPPKITYCLFCGLEPRAEQSHLTDSELQRLLTDRVFNQHFRAFALGCMP